MSFELDLEKYNFKEYKEFDINFIIIDPVVRAICKQNTCGQYSRNYMCPPAVKEIDEWKKDISSYKNAIMVSKVYQTKSSYDFKAMFDGIKDFRKTLIKIKEDLLARSPEKRILFLGAGPCTVCKECVCNKDKPCRHPDKAFPSVEACGIDVMSLCKSVGVAYNNGKNTITYIGAILY